MEKLKNKNNPLISVVIPCYNHGQYLEEAILSVKKQTFNDYEIIVVNDGSTDSYTIKILDELKIKYKDISFIDQGNGHLSNARNNGIRKSRGEFFLPLDADDAIAATMLAECYEKIIKNPGAGFVYTYTKLFGDTNEVMVRKSYNFYDLLQTNYVVASSLFRKSAWENVGGYDENMKSGYEDWEFLIRLGKKGWFGEIVRKPLFGYRKHGKSMVDEAIKKHAINCAYIKKKHSDIYSKKELCKIKKKWKKKVNLENISESVLDKFDSIRFKLKAAGTLKVENWINNPLKTLGRCIPIGCKKKINKLFKKDLIDTSYFGKDIN